jgi:hypothetical protein
VITKAEKGNSVIILKITNCDNKITDFIKSRDLALLRADPTQAYYKKKKSRFCKTLISNKHNENIYSVIYIHIK